MEDEKKEIPASQNEAPAGDPYRLLYVLLVVLIICGGNGIGIITAAIIWKFTGAVTAAVILAVAITLIAFACGMVVVVVHNRKK